MKSILLTYILILTQTYFANVSTISRAEYISAWKIIAVQQMNEYGIPASVTMAQGILESGNGNSKLAIEGNNHFGIKCHDWDGEKMYLDDDAENECFRVYSDAKESYVDHSEFLKKHKRYDFLFNYSLSDYKAWANGLKQAGYATSPTYADKLIKIIEDEKLYELDKQKLSNETIVSEHIEFVFAQHQIFTNSIGVNYIVVKKGDTFYQIAKELGVSMNLLRRYNDFHPEKEYLTPGEFVYTEPKKWRSKKDQFYITKERKTLREISQEKGIRLKSILRKNNSTLPDEQLPKGTKVFLK
jgi:LysM repeat protein